MCPSEACDWHSFLKKVFFLSLYRLCLSLFGIAKCFHYDQQVLTEAFLTGLQWIVSVKLSLPNFYYWPLATDVLSIGVMMGSIHLESNITIN